MLTNDMLYILYSIGSILISMVMTHLFWRRRKSAGALAMSLMMLCAAEWTLFAFVSDMSSSLLEKTFWDKLTYFGVVFIPVLWFIFAIQYTRSDKVLKKRFYFYVSIIPILTLIFMLTDSIHGLFVTNRRLVPLPNTTISFIAYDFGLWFWVHVTYTCALTASAMFILQIRLIKSLRVYRNQAILLILAGCIPLLNTCIYLLGIGPFNNMDMTPISFAFAGMLFFIGIFRYKTLDLIPIARETIIETMDDLIIVLDMKNRITDINRSARELLAKNNEELIGRQISELFDMIPSGEKFQGEIVINLDDHKAFFDLKTSPIFNKNNAVIGSFIVLSNITKLYETMDKLEKSKVLAESANKAKSEFLATMSHEIRTPINGIIGMAELMETAALNDQERENLKALQYSADSLLSLINGILDFSKIEAGKMVIDAGSFDIRELTSSIVKSLGYNINSKPIQLVYAIDPSVPTLLWGDYWKLRQVLTNLISNSYKFTEAGEIKLSIKCLKNSGNEAQLEFIVSDTGIGIPENQLYSLFQVFHQLDNSITRKYGGTGLGLSIVKSLVELMGGSIHVESIVGIGSSFSFELPFKVPAQEAAVEEIVAASSVSVDIPLKVLIAEDSKVNQMLITQLLKKKNWESDIAQDGKEVLAKLEIQAYDIILMDIQMPEIDGYQAAQIIRENEKHTNTHTPIIALTANATVEDRERCFACGMDDFLSKPIKSEMLYACIEKHTNTPDHANYNEEYGGN